MISIMSDLNRSLLDLAIVIATSAHAGQTDKAGKPYILHPLRVMLAVNTPEEQITAVLHDVVEDTSLGLSDLIKYGFSEEVIQAVDALTKKENESRVEAAYRAASNPIARVVKTADVKDNMKLERIATPTAKDYARMDEYKKVLEILNQNK